MTVTVAPAFAGLVDELAARAAENDREARFPAEGIALVHQAGMLTSTVHPRYGGQGAGVADTARILAELGRGDPSVALITAMTLFAHAGQGERPSWPEEIYTEALSESRERPVLINALRVEPALGSPSRGGLPETVARRTAGGWRITGRKIYSTGSVGLRWMVVWARTDETQPRIGGFLVRNDAQGIEIEPTWDHLGLRASVSHDVIFTSTPAEPTLDLSTVDDVRPPAAEAWQIGLPALYLGVARSALDWLVGFLRERVPSGLGKPLSTLPRFETGVGEIAAAIQVAEESIFGLARRIDEGDRDAVTRVGVTKAMAMRSLISAVDQALALAGNPGLTRHNPLQRHHRDILCGRVHAPQEDAAISAIGRAVLR